MECNLMQKLLNFAIASAALFTSSLALAVPFSGPDAFGYNGSDIAFGLTDIRTSGTNIGLDNQDDGSFTNAIGFDFDFYGNIFTETHVSTNGFISFGANNAGKSGCCSGDPIPTPGSGLDNFIAGFWEDLNPGNGGSIRTQTIGDVGSREFIVGYYDVRDFDDPGSSINTFEIILHELTNDIEIQIFQIQFDDVDDKTVGIENEDGTDGIEILLSNLLIQTIATVTF